MSLLETLRGWVTRPEPLRLCKHGWRHTFEMTRANGYVCRDCGEKCTDHGIDEGQFVGGYCCTVCNAEWLCDEEKPCQCPVPVMWTTSALNEQWALNATAPPAERLEAAPANPEDTTSEPTHEDPDPRH